MKLTQFTTPLCVALLFSAYVNAAAANSRPTLPTHYYHNFLATDGKTTVSNQNGMLKNIVVDAKGNPGAEYDVNGSCMTDGTGVFINSVKYIEATKLFVAVGYANAPAQPGVADAEQPTQSWFCYSTDGLTWNSMASDSSTDPERKDRFNDIDYGNGFYVAVGQKGDKALVKVLEANDFTKKAWTEIQTADGENTGYAINSIVFGVNKFAAAANDSSIYLFIPPHTPINNSADWLSERARDIPGSANFNQVIYAKDKNMYVLIGDNSTIFYSDAGAEGFDLEFC